MNYLILPSIALSLIGFGAAALDGGTTVPLGAVLGSAGTVMIVGMWVSRKVTRFETLCDQFEVQQQANINRLNRIDERLLALDERMWSIERNPK